ncbi:MAG: Ig-like domain-containing protein, partial [Deltaproteobacteria bacterium]|nr:Ig-like domain-containing protein [Deltaproteobacteria bacterium]
MPPKNGVLLAIAFAFGCTNTVERIVYVNVNDGGTNDSGTVDAGANDAGTDAGTADGGTGDGGTFTQVASITLTPAAATMQVGDTLIISATINAIGGGTLTSVAPVWSSTNSTIASVDQQGNVSANGLGEVDIDASAEGVSATAHVTVVSHTVALSVSIVGSGGVSGPGGFSCATGTCTAMFAPGSVVLTATPASGFEFAGWSGAGCAGILPCSVALSAAASVTATFTAEPVLILSVDGAGSVSSTPAGISCSGSGGSCSAAFPAGTAIVLTETPGSGIEFGAWAGACAGTSTTCSLVLDASKSAAATFGHFHSLSVSVTGHGAVSASSGAVQGCSASGGTCSGTYAAGAQVTLTATPGSGAAFSTWTGACASATSTACTVTMGSDV